VGKDWKKGGGDKKWCTDHAGALEDGVLVALSLGGYRGNRGGNEKKKKKDLFRAARGVQRLMKAWMYPRKKKNESTIVRRA